MTKERVRQITKEAAFIIRKTGLLDGLVEYIDLSLPLYSGLVSPKDLLRSHHGVSESDLQALIFLLGDMFPGKYSVFQGRFLTSLTKTEVEALIERVRAEARQLFGITTNVWGLVSACPDVSKDFIRYLLEKGFIDEGCVASRVASLVRCSGGGRPLHKDRIIRLYQKSFPGRKRINNCTVEYHIRKNKELVLIGKGIYTLKENIKPGNLSEILDASLEIISSAGGISNISYVSKRLKEKGIETNGLSNCSLKWFLLDRPGVVSLRKLGIGLRSSVGSDIKVRNTPQLSSIIEVLRSASTPLGLHEIRRELSRRGRDYSNGSVCRCLKKNRDLFASYEDRYTIAEGR